MSSILHHSKHNDAEFNLKSSDESKQGLVPLSLRPDEIEAMKREAMGRHGLSIESTFRVLEEIEKLRTRLATIKIARENGDDLMLDSALNVTASSRRKAAANG